MDRLTLPPPASGLWALAADELHRILRFLPHPPPRYRMGGRTVLAARWHHRASTDIELTVPAGSGLNTLVHDAEADVPQPRPQPDETRTRPAEERALPPDRDPPHRRRRTHHHHDPHEDRHDAHFFENHPPGPRTISARIRAAMHRGTAAATILTGGEADPGLAPPSADRRQE